MNTEVLKPEDKIDISAEEAFAKAAGEEYTHPIQDEPEPEVVPDPEDGRLTLTQADVDRIRQEAQLEAEQKHVKRIRDLSGEVGSLRQKVDTLSTAKAAVEQSGTEAPTTQQIKEAARSPEKLAALKEDFPEWGEMAEELNSEVMATQGKVSALEQRLAAAEATADDVSTLREMRKLDKAHPDWENITSDQSYVTWLQQQTQEIQYAALNSKSASDAIVILNKFKNDMTPPSDTPTAESRRGNDRLERAVQPTSGKAQPQRRIMTAEEAFEEAAKRTMGGR